MPYIKQNRREELKRNTVVKVPGELNYFVTLWCTEYIKENGLSYQTINDVVGALESCKLEFYRRIAVPYEQEKIQANGDVY